MKSKVNEFQSDFFLTGAGDMKKKFNKDMEYATGELAVVPKLEKKITNLQHECSNMMDMHRIQSRTRKPVARSDSSP